MKQEIMSERIQLSEYFGDKPGANLVIENINFDVDNFTRQVATTFVNCKFVFSESSQLRLGKCTLKDSEVIGIEDYEKFTKQTPSVKYGRLLLEGCSITNLKLSASFNEIYISRPEFVKRLEDRSTSKSFQISQATVTNSNIKGKCERVYFDSTRFTGTQKDIWNKEISLAATCNNTVFDRVSLNPYYLSTKCADKSTLDLSGANFIDDWSKLRKRYSGLSLFIVLLLTVVFFLPFVFKITGLLISAKLATETLLNLETVPLWQMLFFGGKEVDLGSWYFLITIILMVYNTIRLLLTVSLARLREEEQFLSDAGFQAVNPHPKKYIWQKRTDYVLSKVFWVVLAISVYKVIEAFSVQVPMY